MWVQHRKNNIPQHQYPTGQRYGQTPLPASQLVSFEPLLASSQLLKPLPSFHSQLSVALATRPARLSRSSEAMHLLSLLLIGIACACCANAVSIDSPPVVTITGLELDPQQTANLCRSTAPTSSSTLSGTVTIGATYGTDSLTPGPPTTTQDWRKDSNNCDNLVSIAVMSVRFYSLNRIYNMVPRSVGL